MKTNLKKKNILLLIFLSAITLGIYIPIWFMKLKKITDTWRIKRKASGPLINIALVFYILEVAIIPVAYIAPFTVGTLERIGNLLLYINIILLLILAFHFKGILEEYFSKIKKKGISLSKIGTLIFTFLYLQYEINNVIEKWKLKTK